jgi:hypothetical protein
MTVAETVYKGKIRPWGKTQRSLATVHLPNDLAKQLAAWKASAEFCLPADDCDHTCFACDW